MTVSTYFTEELQTVDAGKAFSYVIDGTYAENEYSVSGWEVRAGSETAQGHGAYAALYDMGFRFWTPQHTTYPVSVPSGGVTIAKRENNWPYTRIFLSYGYDASASAQSAAYERWRIIRSLNDVRRPSGQTWLSIINAINAEDSFFTNNPTYLAASDLFNLDNGAIEAAVAARVGAYIGQNLNAYDRMAFGVSDASPYDSDEIVRFSNAVITAARQENANAHINILAYANCVLPSTIDCNPGITVDVTLGFNNGGIGYPAMVEGWGAKAEDVGLGGYGDIAAWGTYQLMTGGWRRKTYQDGNIINVPAYSAAGVQMMDCEHGGNFFKNLIADNHAFKYWQTGSSTYDAVLNEAVTLLFGGDSLVADLYQLWGTGSINDATLRQSCAIVDAMADTWYRLKFRQLLALNMQHRKMTYRDAAFSPTYYSKTEQNLRWYYGLANDDFHAYAYARRLANGPPVSVDRPDLVFDAAPHWKRYPAAPTDTDYTGLRDELTARVADVPAVIADLTDLVIVPTVPSGLVGSGATANSTVNIAKEARTLYVLGPGTLTIDYSDSTIPQEVHTVPAGLNIYETVGAGRITYPPGTLWWDGSETITVHYSDWSTWSEAFQDWYVYLPQTTRGRYRIIAGQLRISDSGTQYSYVNKYEPPNWTGVDPAILLPGVAKISANPTANGITLYNTNLFYGLTPHLTLMPRALAKAEFPSISFGKVA